MPEFHVLQCSSCQTFQVHQEGKARKWACKLCGQRQSIIKVYGRGTGKDCRLHVQKLNQLRGETRALRDLSLSSGLQSVQETGPGDGIKPCTTLPPQETPMSKWTSFLDTVDHLSQTADPQDSDADAVDCLFTTERHNFDASRAKQRRLSRPVSDRGAPKRQRRGGMDGLSYTKQEESFMTDHISGGDQLTASQLRGPQRKRCCFESGVNVTAQSHAANSRQYWRQAVFNDRVYGEGNSPSFCPGENFQDGLMQDHCDGQEKIPEMRQNTFIKTDHMSSLFSVDSGDSQTSVLRLSTSNKRLLSNPSENNTSQNGRVPTSGKHLPKAAVKSKWNDFIDNDREIEEDAQDEDELGRFIPEVDSSCCAVGEEKYTLRNEDLTSDNQNCPRFPVPVLKNHEVGSFNQKCSSLICSTLQSNCKQSFQPSPSSKPDTRTVPTHFNVQQKAKTGATCSHTNSSAMPETERDRGGKLMQTLPGRSQQLFQIHEDFLSEDDFAF